MTTSIITKLSRCLHRPLRCDISYSYNFHKLNQESHYCGVPSWNLGSVYQCQVSQFTSPFSNLRVSIRAYLATSASIQHKWLPMPMAVKSVCQLVFCLIHWRTDFPFEFQYWSDFISFQFLDFKQPFGVFQMSSALPKALRKQSPDRIPLEWFWSSQQNRPSQVSVN